MLSSTLIRLELRQLLRSRALVAGLVLFTIAAIGALVHGHTVIARQRAAIAASGDLQREDHEAILRSQPRDGNAGDQLYYLFFHTVHEPSPWAAVSLGQRDVQPFNLKVRLLALQGQLHDGDIVSPLLAAFGSFDLAFVIVFVTPLFVIALTHGLWSGERELGTWSLIRSQPRSGLAVLGMKLAVRGGVILTPVLLVLSIAIMAFRLPLDARLASVATLVVCYVCLWLGLSLAVAALRRSSDFNLIALLGLWIVWAIVGPATANAIAAARYPIPEELELTVRQRQGYHEGWDRPLPETMARFYASYPEWRDVPVPADRYSNAWYYAMQQRGDDEARPAVEAHRHSQAQRTRWVSRAMLLFPPALMQQALNAIARTDLESHLAYKDSVRDYHERLKSFFFPIVFRNSTIGEVDWAAAPRHRFRDDQTPGPLGGTVGVTLMGVTVACCVAAIAALRRRIRLA